MRVIGADKISKVIAGLCLEANTVLRDDILQHLKMNFKKETQSRPRKILAAIIENASIAKKEKIAICQDTGLPCVFVELGGEVKIKGDLKEAIQKGVEEGYKKGFLRNSLIRDPLLRGKPGYGPAVLHIDLVKGNKLKLAVLPKGFGCENKAQLKMFNPTAKIEDIKKFIIEVVRSAGPDACPPYVVGVGIGGTADYAMYLAKKALLRNTPACRQAGNTKTGKLESELLRSINKLNIGAMGLGGKATALAVNIETYPTHIAGLPVAVNISCHALRRAEEVL